MSTKAHPLVIPEACLLQHLIVLGKTGSGKSSTLRHLVEWLLSQGKRVCVIDPKGDWYGLPSSADGKGDGFPVILFGDFKADRSDVPMDAHAGKELAAVIGKSKQACVLGFNGWMPEARTQFWIDFASALFNQNQGELYLVIDEVHNFAPKGKVLSPQAGKALHWTNRLASEGRGLGIKLLMASQRPQKVHNDTLTSCETLIAMRVIHASDRTAVKEWIDGCGDGTSGKQVLDGLASMKRGTAWVWSPDAMFLEKVSFPMFKTFDSFSESAITVPRKWATVDIEEVKQKLARVVEQKKQNDPAELRREITRLQRELATAQKEKPAPEIKEVCVVDKEAVQELIEEANDWAALSIALMKRLEAVTPGQRTAVERAVLQPSPRPTQTPKTFVHHASGTVTKASPAASSVANGTLSSAELRVLKSLYWLKDEERTPVKVAFFANYTVNGHFNNTMGALRSKGYVQAWSITNEGINMLPADIEHKPTGSKLREWLREKLTSAENKILDVLVWHQKARIPVDQLAEQAGFTVNGHFNNSLGHLRTLQIAEGGAREGVKAIDILFDF